MPACRGDTVLGKLVLKTAAATFSLLVALALILFGVVSLASPAAMMSFTDSLDMNGASAYYSVAVYDRTGEISDLAVAVEKSYDAGHYVDAAAYGEKLLNDSDFSAYCAARDEDTQGNAEIRSSYAQYAGGIVSSAQYYNGEGDKALNTAFDALADQTFPETNAVSLLTSAAINRDDVEFCENILARLENLTVENVQDQENLQSFILELQTYCAQ